MKKKILFKCLHENNLFAYLYHFLYFTFHVIFMNLNFVIVFLFCLTFCNYVCISRTFVDLFLRG